MSAKGLLSIVLHAHKPFTRHPEREWDDGEDRFFSAVAETYIPLILMCERLVKDNIRPAFTLSLSPTLCAMLEDELLEKRCRAFMELRFALADQELAQHPEGSPEHEAALAYQALYSDALDTLERYSGDLITPLKQLQQNGQIELITSTATHAILPLLIHPEAVRAQVAAAAQDYQERFSRKTRGLWLAECAFEPRMSQHIQLAGMKYFFLDGRAFNHANPKPKHGTLLPARLSGGVFACAREESPQDSSQPQFFAKNGGGAYRDYSHDLGFEAEEEYIRPFLAPDGKRRALGIKYNRIGGGVYDPNKASEAARAQAAEFLKRRVEQVENACSGQNIRPVINCVYDADLFGQYWFEGPQFLEQVIRLIRQERPPVQMATSGECLEAAQASVSEDIEPDASSLSDRYLGPWISPANDWIYPRLNAAAERMIDLANRFQFQDLGHVEKRALNQAARELMLAQSSDWAALMRDESRAAYAKERILGHCGDFHRLSNMLSEKNIDEAALHEIESRDNIFFSLDFRLFASASTF